MAKTRFSRIALMLVAVAMIVAVFGLTVMAEEVSYDFTSYANTAAGKYDPAAPANGGWEVTHSGLGGVYVVFAEKSFGFSDDATKKGKIDENIRLTYHIPEANQVNVKDYGQIAFTRRLSNGNYLTRVYGAQFAVILNMDDGQTITRYYDWTTNLTKIDGHTNVEVVDTEIGAAIEALNGNPKLVSFTVIPYVDGDMFHIYDDMLYKPAVKDDPSTPDVDETAAAVAGSSFYFLMKYFNLIETADIPVVEGVEDNYDEKTVTEHDGKIIGLDAAKTYKYAPVYSNDADFVEVTGVTEITGLKGGVYQIKGVEEGKADSAKVIVVIPKNTLGGFSITDYSAFFAERPGVNSLTPVYGSWSGWNQAPYGNGTSMAAISLVGAMYGGFNKIGTSVTSTSYAATAPTAGAAKAYRQGAMAYTYVPTVDEMFDVDTLGVTAKFTYWNQPFTDMTGSTAAIRIYTNGDESNPYVAELRWTASSINIFAGASEALDGYVTRIDLINLYDFDAIPDAGVYKFASAPGTASYLQIGSCSTYALEQAAAPEGLSVVATGEDTYSIIGLDRNTTYAYSADNATWTKVAGEAEIANLAEGTYYVKVLPAREGDLASEAVVLEASGAVDFVGTPAANGNAIVGLDATVAYEYSKVDFFGFAGWTDVAEGATEITDLDNALWAVRVKGEVASAPAYVIIGNDSAAQDTIINVDENGVKSANLTTTAGAAFNKGAWSAATGAKLGKYEFSKNYAALQFPGFTHSIFDTPAFENILKVGYNYVMTDEQIVPLSKLSSLDLRFNFYGTIGDQAFENVLPTGMTYRVRLYVANGDQPYYDFRGNWKGSSLMQTVNFTTVDDADAYVTAIQIYLVDYIPEGAHIRGRFNAAGTVMNRECYPILWLSDWVLKQNAETPVLTVSATTDGYAISGLDATKNYAYSTDNITWTSIEAGATQIEVANAGTYYVKVLTNMYFNESEAAVVTINGKQAAVKDIIALGNTIIGLDANAKYEYAKADYFGVGEWTDVAEGATEIADLEAGLWAVRIKEGDGYLAGVAGYALVGADAAKQATVLNVDENGVKSLNINGSAAFNKGAWSTSKYTALAAFETGKTTHAAVLNNGFGKIYTAEADAFDQLKGADFTYVMTDEQIVALNDLSYIKFALAFNGNANSKVFDNLKPSENPYRVRVHVAGGEAPYYDFDGIWAGHGVAGTLYFDTVEDPNAYVTAIQVFMIPYIPEGAVITSIAGRDVYPIFRLYDYVLKSTPAAPELFMNGVADGYAITGFDPDKTYAYSTDNKTWTTIEAGTLTFKVTEAGKYYFKSIQDAVYFESEVTTIVIAGKQPEVTGLTLEDNTIKGLDASVVYEYTVVNALGENWITIENATEIADLEAGVYAVRIKADEVYLAGAAQYILIKGENYGSIAHAKIIKTTNSFAPGYWVSGDKTIYLRTGRTIGGVSGTVDMVQNVSTNYATRHDYYYMYTMANDEVIPVQNLADHTIYTAYGAPAALGADPITLRVRVYVAGGSVDYYDCDIKYVSKGQTYAAVDFVAADHIPEDATGYVTALKYYPIWDADVPANIKAGSYYPVFALGHYVVAGNESLEPATGMKYRVAVESLPAPRGLSIELVDANKYANGYAITGLDANKLYEYSTDRAKWVAIPAGSTEFAINAGIYYVRYASMDGSAPSSDASVFVPMTNPVFGDINVSTYATGWGTTLNKWSLSEKYVTTYVGKTTPILKTIKYTYEFAEADQFVVDNHPFFSIDFNTQMVGGLDTVLTGKYFPDAVLAVNVYVKGEANPYVLTTEHKGFGVINGYTANKCLVNLLEKYPELSGKTVTKFEILPYSNLDTTCASYHATGEAYFRLFYVGFFDTAVATDSLALAATGYNRIATFKGIEAEANTILSVGSTLTASDITVYEVYSNGTRYPVTNYTVELPDNFATEAGTYTVAINGRLNTACTVDVSVGLDHIEIRNNPSKVNYFDGDKVDLSGIELVAVLTNGDEIIVASGYKATVDAVALDMTSITVVYGGKEASFDITVTAVEVASIAINTLPDKENKGGYEEGEALDFTGLTIKAVYNNGVEEIVGLDGIEATYGELTMTRGTALTITYGGKTISVVLTVNSKAIAEVSIATLPEKLTYFAGEELDITGLTVNVLYEDGTTAVVSEGFVIGTTLEEAGTVTVEVLYEGFNVTFDVEVVVVETAFIMEFPAKTEYVIGEEFDAEGLVLYVLYSSGEEALLTEGFELIYDEFTAEGEYEVVLKYFDYEEPFVVTVVAATEPEPEPAVVESITVTAPTKTEYTVGDTLDLAGMVVTANLSDGTTENVTAAATVDTTTLATAGNVTVTVTYEGFTATFVVTVAEKVVEPEEPENIAEGTIEGTTVNWVITTDGTLTVSGAGEVPNYTRSATAPWYAYTKQIKKIVVADGITKLGDYCFYNLSKATAIEISTTVKFLGVQFIRQTAITEVTLTSDVTITANAFGRADNLKTLNLSEDVKNLQGNIFYQETVTIKAPENSFAHKYAEIYASKFASSAATVAYESDGTTAKLPIVRFAAAGDNAFFAIYENAKGNWALEVSGIGVMKNFPYVSAKNIAKGFTFSPMYYIGDEEAKIDGVEPEAKIASITVKEGITTVGNYIFYKCTKATTLTLPEGITSIGQGAFRLCQRIAKITLPEAVTKIEKNAFLSCGKLVEIYIPEGVTTVGEGIFEKCDSINSLVVKTKSAAAIEVISAEYPMVTIVTEF